MSVWNLDDLKGRLEALDIEGSDSLVAAWLAGDIDTAHYGLAAAACATHRRFDLAAGIFEAAFRQGVRSFEACHVLEFAWRDARDGHQIVRHAGVLSGALAQLVFRWEDTPEERQNVQRILADIARLARIEEGEDTGPIAPDSLHAFATAVMWQRIWACHSALQSTRAQRLARAYLSAIPTDDATFLLAMAAFFGFNGEAAWAIEAIRARAFQRPAQAEAISLRLAIAYEAELRDAFLEAQAELLGLRDQVADMAASWRPHIASGQLYGAFDCLDHGDRAGCLAIVAQALADYADEPWVLLFEQARGMALEPHDRPAAVGCYERALQAEPGLRTPFLIDVAADAAVAEGRWDVAHAYLERRAAGLRPYYRILKDQAAGEPAEAGSLPERAVLLSGWGVGDDVIAYGLLRRLAPGAAITVALDQRLIGMAQRARPGARFLPQIQLAQAGAEAYWQARRGIPAHVDFLRCTLATALAAKDTGTALIQEDLTAIHAARNGAYPGPPTEPVFTVDPARLAAMRHWLSSATEGRAAVGIGWRSGLRTRTRARTFLNEAQVARLMRAAPVSWVLLQYDWDHDERARIEAEAGCRFLVCPDLDLKQDLEGVAALACACNLVLCTGVATRDVAAAAGAHVVSLHHGRANAEAWRRDALWRDMIFPNMIHVDPRDGGDGVIAQATGIVATLLQEPGRHVRGR